MKLKEADWAGENESSALREYLESALNRNLLVVGDNEADALKFQNQRINESTN
jgi:hypothetical protein